MSDIKLPRQGAEKNVPVRTTFPESLYDLLKYYAAAYEATYGETIQPEKLVPVIVAEYLRKDSGFKKYIAKQQLPKPILPDEKSKKDK